MAQQAAEEIHILEQAREKEKEKKRKKKKKKKRFDLPLCLLSFSPTE